MSADRPLDGEAHVWVARADDPTIEARAGVLADVERARAGRFVHERDRRAFLVARVARREVLARALGRDPKSLVFVENAYGKPRVTLLPGDADVRFNVSRSGEVVLVAVTSGREVGVDVEAERPLPDLADVAGSHFAPEERDAVLARSGESRVAAFFTCWSRKEAVIKAIGMGLSFPLHAFEVEVDPGAHPRLKSSRDPRLDPSRWSMHAVALGVPRHAAALVVEGSVSRVVLRAWRNA